MIGVDGESRPLGGGAGGRGDHRDVADGVGRYLCRFVISLPLGFAAANNVNGSAWGRFIVRFGLNADRAVDTLIVAIIFVGAFELGQAAR